MSMCIYHGNLALADAVYLAGLIDGEGSIAVSRTKTSASAKAHYTKSQHLNQRGIAA